MNHPQQTFDVEATDVAKDMTLGEHLLIVRRHFWIIAGFAASGAALALGWSLMQTPIYESSASVVIDRESPSLLDRDRDSVSEVSPEYLQTHFELLKSHEVIRKTADVLNLSEQPEYRVGPSRLAALVQTGKRSVLSLLGSGRSSDEDGSKPVPELERFRQRMKVTPVRGSRVVHITVQSQDQKFAAKAANTLASVYIDNVMELKASTKEKASKWFSTHLEELRRKVEESEFNLYAYRSKYGLMDAHERQTGASQQLSELNSELVKAEMKRADAQVRHQQIASLLQNFSGETPETSGLDDAVEILNSHLIQVLRTEEIKVSSRVAELADKYGPLHPKMAHVKSELDDLRRRIHNEMQKIFNSVKHEYEADLSRVKMIRNAVERHKQEKMKLEQHEVEHAILDRKAQSNRQLYDTFLRQMKETNLTSGMSMSSIYLADPVVAPRHPVKPTTRLNIMLGLLAGLLGGIGLAFVLDYHDHSFRSPNDVERYLPRLPLFGIVPMLPNGHRKWSQKLLAFGNGAGSAPLHLIAEHYRTIRTNILLSSVNRPLSSLVVTSPGENEGKTTVAVNLAFAMGQLEALRVVLINADLRKPAAKKFPGFQAEDAKGLAHFLTGQATFQEVIHPTEIANLWVIPHGLIPSNPSELLHSERMVELIKHLTENYFRVIVDAPPVLPVADSIILSTQVDGAVLVVSEGETSREACRVALNRVTGCGGNVVGVVLQKAHLAQVPKYVRQYHAALN